MTKTCSHCLERFDAEYDPTSKYRGDFCSFHCEEEWKKARGMKSQSDGLAGVLS